MPGFSVFAGTAAFAPGCGDFALSAVFTVFEGATLGGTFTGFFSAGFAITGFLAITGAFLLSAMDFAREGLDGAALRAIGDFTGFAAGFAAGLAAGLTTGLAAAFAADFVLEAGLDSLRCTVFLTAAALPLPGGFGLDLAAATGLRAGALLTAGFFFAF